MNTNLNTSLQGHYTLYDENMNVLCETDNLITDWGMRRLVGDRSMGAPHPEDGDLSSLGFCNNIACIVIGTGTTDPIYSDFKLVSAIPLTEYQETNDASTTGTTLSTAANGDLLITFTKFTRFKFNSTINSPTGYRISEIGCSWTNQTFQENNRYGIFSRAKIPNPFTVQADSTVFARYRLTIQTDCNQIKTSMYHLSGTGATAFPNNKTNVRRLPFYTMRSTPNGSTYSSQVINNGYSAWSAMLEYPSPLFENPGLWNVTYTGNASECNGWYNQQNTFGTALGNLKTYKNWWLQMYTKDWSVSGALSATNGGANPSQRYLTFTSTTTANIGNYDVHYGIYINSDYDRLGSGYDTVILSNLNGISSKPTWTGRKPAETFMPSGSAIELTKPSANTWKRTLRFLFTPGQFKPNTTVLKLYSATVGYYGGWNGCGSGIYVDYWGEMNWGLVTVFDAPYTPGNEMYTGFEYNFTFNRV